MAEEHDKGPAVKIPPPLIVLFFFALALGADYLMPINLLNWTLLQTLGWGICSSALVIAIVTALQFLKAKTNIEPWKPDTKLIISGCYCYSRNPIYLAFIIFSLGLGLVLGSIWVLFSAMPSMIVLQTFVIKKEEKYLTEKFGEAYLSYCRKVRRWL